MSSDVTFLLTDVEGSTRLWERDPETMRRALARHDELAAQSISTTGGSVVKPRGEGDSIFSVFDEAADAVAGAVAFQRALEQEDWPDGFVIRTRAALHTGPTEKRDDDYYGPTVNRAARLRAIGHGRQVLLSHATYEVVYERVPGELEIVDLGVHRLKDLSAPEHVRQLYWPGLDDEEFPPLASLHPHLTNLPSHDTTFVGREAEVGEIEGLLDSARLVTLVGSAGVGKSRLATHVGAEVLHGFPDGVWRVDVGPLADEAGLVTAMAAVLGVRGDRRETTRDALVTHLSDLSTLVLLDNCDELRSECAELVRLLLADCGDVHVLATGRTPLGVAGEVVWETPPLSLDAARELFAERAAAAGGDGGEDVVGRLGGMPLAIELAAGHGLAPDGHTMESLLEQAHAALSAQEGAALRRLSVFSGAFSRDAALHVLDGIEEPEATLDQLVGRGLVTADPAAPAAPYRVAAAVRPYARERLEEAGEAHAAAAAHARWHVDAARRGELEESAGHHDVRRAFAWTLAAAGRLAVESGDAGRGRELHDEALALARETGDEQLLAELAAG